MRLKSLEVVGFKSFLEPTTISFAPGITAVVGPNGCGKSNVVDAIRWVLGEQAPTRLRGRTIEDLIYAGNDSNPAAGMAEVSLLLEADDQNPLPEPFSALSEVEVTRRVYRSGDSEYLLNKIPGRLKDITEFFMAAQIHSRGYAIIEQGKIEEIIQAKPAELRSLVEEAAGLSLFKGRREMSQRKLERVRENLDRLNDVLGEIERQLSFARRQAKKAEAYKLIRQELDSLERLNSARRLLALRAELQGTSAREAELTSRIENSRGQSVALQDAFDQAARDLQSHRDQLAGASRELENLRASALERERTRAFMERRIAAIAERRPKLSARLLELEAKAVAARASRAELSARLAREYTNEDGLHDCLPALKARSAAALESVAETESQIELLKDQISDLMREAGVIRSRLADLTGERAELAARLENPSRHPELESAVNSARQQVECAAASRETLRRDVEQRESDRALAVERELQARAAVEQDAARLAALRESLSVALGRAEGHAPGAAAERLRVVLESLNGDRPQKPPRLLLDVVKAPAHLSPALGAVLGEQLGAVIVESPSFALRAVEVLKEKQSGRMSFVPESMVAVAHQPVQASGVRGRLLDMLEVDPAFVHVAEAILGHVLLAEDLHSAVAASNLNGHGAIFVTPEGDVVWPGRIISGGSAAGVGLPAPDEPLSVEDAGSRLAHAERQHQVLRLRLEQYLEARTRSHRELANARGMVAQAEHELEQHRTALAEAERQLTLASAHQQDAARRLSEIDELTTASNERLEQLAKAERENRSALAQCKAGLAQKKSAAEKSGAEILEAGAKVEARRSHLAALEQELSHLKQLADQLESQIVEDSASQDRSEAEQLEFQRELQQLAEQDRDARARQATLETEIARLTSLSESRAAESERQREAVSAAQKQLKALEDGLVECGLQRERASTLSQELARAFAEKFRVRFEDARAELEPALAGRDAEQDEARLRELRAKAERIGEVNLAAESEVRDLEERAAMLGAQKADLEAAFRDLTHTIQKLNREARRRFAQTFEGAARNFAEVLPKLMRGAKGRLELETPDDLLESGVNIMVQPAAKKIRDISLLSGGEKALSAMALVFSLFLLNPSPFCLLDEVDAPLDEFSVAAFSGLIAELKERSQFILITHNQRTMQTADHIHGVTMQQPGVSRVISLQLPKAA